MGKQEILLKSGTNEMELLTFLLGDQHFGVNVSKVQSILQFDPSLVTKMPNVPSAMLGMMLYRERTIPLIDLSVALDMETGLTSERQIVIVTQFNNAVSSFRVDGVNRIHRLSWDTFVPVGDFISSSNANSIVGSVHVDDSEVMVVDMENILAEIVPSMVLEEVKSELLENTNKAKRENIQIIFAEDSRMMRNNLVRILHGVGYTNIRAFDNGQKAYETLSVMCDQAESGKKDAMRLPDIIISDIEMPEMDGLTLCRKAKEDLGLKQIPVIMFSSLINEQMVMKCQNIGADGYVTKPETNKLVAMLDKMCFDG
ncbi:MAG: hypothetical protein BA865_16130 [Desulfobacterales bacterium S5133MH4]|nr:MAG: hypothetical protein BA865_16130 [Desulfobacterales bacterium S5133MH4]